LGEVFSGKFVSLLCVNVVFNSIVLVCWSVSSYFHEERCEEIECYKKLGLPDGMVVTNHTDVMIIRTLAKNR